MKTYENGEEGGIVDNQMTSNKKIKLDELDYSWERIFNKNPDVKNISMETF